VQSPAEKVCQGAKECIGKAGEVREVGKMDRHEMVEIAGRHEAFFVSYLKHKSNYPHN
jgi:hypothetical protein